MDPDKESWSTRWGTLHLQSERGIHEKRRLYYAQWHTNSHGKSPPRVEVCGYSRAAIQRAIHQWVEENGGEVL